MPTENRYGIYPVGLNGVNLTQITDQRIDAGISRIVVGAGGEINPRYVAKGK
jgi:hypothetical protein